MFFQVAHNNFYEIGFTKKTTYLLPPPYKTQCADYREDLRYKGYKTRDSCITRCILRVKNSTCANYYSVLVEDMFCSQQDPDDASPEKLMCPHDKQVSVPK